MSNGLKPAIIGLCPVGENMVILGYLNCLGVTLYNFTVYLTFFLQNFYASFYERYNSTCYGFIFITTRPFWRNNNLRRTIFSQLFNFITYKLTIEDVDMLLIGLNPMSIICLLLISTQALLKLLLFRS